MLRKFITQQSFLISDMRFSRKPVGSNVPIKTIHEVKQFSPWTRKGRK